MSSGIRNNFYIGKEFANMDLAKERIRAYAVETRRNLDFKVNDKRRIRVICNGVVPTLNSKNEYVDKIQGHNQDISKKGKGIMQDAKEDKMSCPWLLYLSKGDKSKWDYANELQRCNLDTIVKIDVYGEEDHEKPTRMFRRIYICLGALKRGFKETRRELLGLDGAFMRGQYSGQMLTAMGMDANNGIYPVAYGIVESENQSWFLTCLANDFDLYTNSNFTFITDRQKGLIPTIAKLFPAVEHRFCVRHINENMNITWKGGDYKEMLWKCATSTTVVRFEKNMAELKNYNKKAHEWLSKIPPEHWSRAYFSSIQLLDARNSSIITSLEYGREYLMKRIVIVQKIIQKSNGPLTPSVTKLFNKIKEAASECTVDWNGSDLFQVKGIPCKHAIALIHDMADNGMDVGTPEDWSKFKCPTTLLPPKKALQTGRPPKNRKKSKGEITMVKGHKLTRTGTTVTYSNCKGIGHNKRGCKGIGSSGGQMFDMPTREPVGSETMSSQSVASQHVPTQTRSRGPVTSEPLASQTVGSETMASQSVASQPVAIQTKSRGPIASEHVASQTVTRKLVARKPVTRKSVQNKSAANKRVASQINEPASQASHSLQPASQALRLPTSPIKRTKMSAYRLTPDS
ncbi:mutator type transposase [Tanacetum coccineum]